MTKTCTKCKEVKLLTEFHEHKASKCGYRPTCKLCRKVYYSANRDHIIEYSKTYKQNNPDKNYEHCKVYRLRHKIADNKRKRKWEQNHPEYMREKGRKRRALKHSVNENYTRSDEVYTKALFDNTCACCGSTHDICIDHHQPLIKGNALTRQNAVVLCRPCNASKRDKDPKEFYEPAKLLWIESKLTQL